VFDELKQVFTTKPVLAALDLDKEFIVEADTSNYTTGGVLLMKCSDNVTPDSHLGHKSGNSHLNNKNNQLERQAQPPRNVPLDA